jgi:hypothetical protein
MNSQPFSKKINLISLDIFIDYIKEIDNKKLMYEILNFSTPIKQDFIEDKNHSYYEDMRYPFGCEESEKLINLLIKKVSEIVGKEMEMEAIWSLTLNNGQSVAMHSHKSNFHVHDEEYYSIAYYVSSPEGSADLCFSATACNTLENTTQIRPEEGMLVVFNSFVPHMTNRHKSDISRTVISANFTPKYPDLSRFQDWSAYQR